MKWLECIDCGVKCEANDNDKKVICVECAVVREHKRIKNEQP